MNPYRVADPADVAERELHERGLAIAKVIRLACAEVYLATPHVGPRMNVTACVEGLGLASLEESGTPAWLLIALGEIARG